MASLTPSEDGKFLRAGVLVQALIHLAIGITALAINPDFSVGDDATAAKVLGVDFNGWHAVTGLALWLPALFAVRRTDLTLWFSFATIGAVLGSSLFFLYDETVFGLYALPDLKADLIYHVVSAAALGAVVAIHLITTRKARERHSVLS